MPAVVDCLVLDTAPLIAASLASVRASKAKQFYSVPGVIAEVRDARSKQSLALWKDEIVLRNPKPEAVRKGKKL